MNFQVEQFSNISLHICQLFSELGIENGQQSILHSLHVRHGIVYSTIGHLHLLHQHSNLHSQGYYLKYYCNINVKICVKL